MAADERVTTHPVQQRVAGQVQDAVRHLVDPLGPAGRGEHVEADVLPVTRVRSVNGGQIYEYIYIERERVHRGYTRSRIEEHGGR